MKIAAYSPFETWIKAENRKKQQTKNKKSMRD